MKSFPGVRALDCVDFSLQRGEIRGLLGANGAGKSTLIKILAGVYQKDGGEIFIDGRREEVRGTLHAARLGLAFVHQEVELIQRVTAAEALLLGMEPTRGPLVDWRRLREQAQAVLDRLGVQIDARTPVAALSLAQRQMLAIARTLVEERKVIVFDEPTARLEAAETERLFELIRRLNKLGASIIYVSQRLEEVFRICQSVTVMRNGQIVATRPIAETNLDDVIRLMVGTEVKERYPKRARPIGEELLRVQGAALGPQSPGVSFTVRRGEVLGIYGPVGAGKTELARALFGVDPLAKGEIFLQGRRLTIRSPGEAIRQGVVLIPEERRSQGLLPTHGVHRNISLPSLAAFQRRGLIDGRRELAVARQLIGDLRVKTPAPDTQVRLLSGGNQQKVVLGKWLTTRAQVFILDEPTAGVDVGAKVEIYRLVEDIAEKGAGIILISSELEEVLGLADRVLVMRDGEIVLETEPARTTPDEVMAYSLGVRSTAAASD